MDEGYRTGSPHWACPRAVIAQVLLDGIEEDAQGAVEGFAVVLEVIA